MTKEQVRIVAREQRVRELEGEIALLHVRTAHKCCLKDETPIPIVWAMGDGCPTHQHPIISHDHNPLRRLIGDASPA